MRTSGFDSSRRKFLVVGAAAALLAIIIWLLVLSGSSPRPSPASGQKEPTRAASSSLPGASGAPLSHLPVTASPAGQSNIESELAKAEPSTPAPLKLGSLPAAGYSIPYPAVSAADRYDADSYAMSFVTELLNRSYAGQSRSDLLAWAEAEEAPNTLPGVPANLQQLALVMSLAGPAGATGPVPSPPTWTAESKAAEVDTVSDLQVAVAPEWLSLTATGWQPSDPAMTMLTVTGALDVRAGSVNRSESFSMELTLSTAGSHAGYGAVAVDDWSVM